MFGYLSPYNFFRDKVNVRDPRRLTESELQAMA